VRYGENLSLEAGRRDPPTGTLEYVGWTILDSCSLLLPLNLVEKKLNATRTRAAFDFSQNEMDWGPFDKTASLTH